MHVPFRVMAMNLKSPVLIILIDELLTFLDAVLVVTQHPLSTKVSICIFSSTLCTIGCAHLSNQVPSPSSPSLPFLSFLPFLPFLPSSHHTSHRVAHRSTMNFIMVSSVSESMCRLHCSFFKSFFPVFPQIWASHSSGRRLQHSGL